MDKKVSTKNKEIKLLESIYLKLSKLIESVEIIDEIEEEEKEYFIPFKEEDETIQLDKKVFDIMKEYCENKNNLFIGMS